MATIITTGKDKQLDQVGVALAQKCIKSAENFSTQGYYFTVLETQSGGSIKSRF